MRISKSNQPGFSSRLNSFKFAFNTGLTLDLKCLDVQYHVIRAAAPFPKRIHRSDKAWLKGMPLCVLWYRSGSELYVGIPSSLHELQTSLQSHSWHVHSNKQIVNLISIKPSNYPIGDGFIYLTVRSFIFMSISRKSNNQSIQYNKLFNGLITA